MDIFCWWADHWFLSLAVIGLILYMLNYFLELEVGAKEVVGSCLIQLIFVKSIGYFHGSKCLELENSFLERKVNLNKARIDMRL